MRQFLSLSLRFGICLSAKHKGEPWVRLCLLTTIAKTAGLAHIQFWPRPATSTVPSGSMLTAIMGFRGFACASCFSSVEVLKSYVDSHDPEDTAARKYWLP